MDCSFFLYLRRVLALVLFLCCFSSALEASMDLTSLEENYDIYRNPVTEVVYVVAKSPENQSFELYRQTYEMYLNSLVSGASGTNNALPQITRNDWRDRFLPRQINDLQSLSYSLPFYDVLKRDEDYFIGDFDSDLDLELKISLSDDFEGLYSVNSALISTLENGQLCGEEQVLGYWRVFRDQFLSASSQSNEGESCSFSAIYLRKSIGGFFERQTDKDSEYFDRFNVSRTECSGLPYDSQVVWDYEQACSTVVGELLQLEEVSIEVAQEPQLLINSSVATTYANLDGGLNLATLTETHDIFRDERTQGIYILGKPIVVDIPYNVDIPHTTNYQNYFVGVLSSDAFSSDFGVIGVNEFPSNDIVDTSEFTLLSDELDYQIKDFDSDGMQELRLRFSDKKLLTLGTLKESRSDQKLVIERSRRIYSTPVREVYPNITSNPVTENSLPGALKGNFDVTRSGDGVYSLPLYSPPGVNGLAPSLAFIYSNSAPNGLMGLGWQMAGLDSLNRCSGNSGFDADNDDSPDGEFGVMFTESDRVCFGDSQLMLIEGSDYWKDGATYSLNDRPGARFERLAGDQFSYTDEVGVTSVFTPVNPMRWGVVSITNLLGNSITISYEVDDGVGAHGLVNSVSYGAYKIVFNYNYGRNDTNTNFWLNSPRIMSRYLSKVTYYHVDEVTEAETPIRDYGLFYNDQSAQMLGPLLLAHIQECRYDIQGAATRCLKPLDVTYSDRSGYSYSKVGSLDERLGIDASTLKRMSRVDWDDDGKQDLLVILEKEDVTSAKVYLSESDEVIEVVSQDRNALPNTLNVFTLKDGTYGAVYQTEEAFTATPESLSYSDGNEVVKLDRMLVPLAKSCKRVTEQTDTTIEKKFYDNMGVEVKIVEEVTTTTDYPDLDVDLSSESLQIPVFAPNPDDPTNDVIVGIRQPEEAHCIYNDETESSDWVIVYPEFTFRTSSIDVGERYSHSLRWNIELFSPLATTSSVSAYLPMSYCGLSNDPQHVRSSMRVPATINDTNGDGQLDVIVPIRNNSVEGNCANLYQGNKWRTEYVNILRHDLLNEIRGAIEPKNLATRVYQTSNQGFETKEPYIFASVSVPESTPPSLFLMQQGSGKNGVMFEERGRLVTARKAAGSESSDGLIWGQSTQHSREVQAVSAVSIGLPSSEPIQGVVQAQYSSEFARFVDTPEKNWASCAGCLREHQGGFSRNYFSGTGYGVDSYGNKYSNEALSKLGNSTIDKSLATDTRFSEAPNDSVSADLTTAEYTFKPVQLKQSVPEFARASNFADTSFEIVANQEASASLQGGQSNALSESEEFEAHHMSSFDPFLTVFADFNYDGKLDALSYEDGLKMYFGGASRFMEGKPAGVVGERLSKKSALSTQIYPIDFDGQGCLDVIVLPRPNGRPELHRCIINDEYQVWFEFVGSFPSAVSGPDALLTLIDMDGDGYDEVVLKTVNGLDVFKQGERKPQLATRFSNTYDTFEDYIDITYSSLIKLAELETPRYSYESLREGLAQEYISAQLVVSEVEVPVTSSTQSLTEYSYFGAKFDYEKNRFLGFEKTSKATDLFDIKIDTFYVGSGENGSEEGFPTSGFIGRPIRMDTYSTAQGTNTLLGSQVYGWAKNPASEQVYLKSMYQVSYDLQGYEQLASMTEMTVDDTVWGRPLSSKTTVGYGGASPQTCSLSSSVQPCQISSVVKEGETSLEYKGQAIRFLDSSSSSVNYLGFDISSGALEAYGLPSSTFSDSAFFSTVTKNEEHPSFPNVVGTTTSGITLNSLSATKLTADISTGLLGARVDGHTLNNAAESFPQPLGYLSVQPQKQLVGDWESSTFALSTEVYLNEHEVFTTDLSYDYRFGTPKTSVSPTGETTTIEYDYLGSPASVIKNNILLKTTSLECGSAASDCTVDGQPLPGAALTQIREKVDLSGAIDSTKVQTIYDLRGRSLATKVYLPESKVVITRTTYDEKGRVKTVLLPCLEGACSGGKVAKTYTYFDTQEKLLITSADGAQLSTTIDSSQSGFSTVISKHTTGHDSDIPSLLQATRILVTEQKYDILGQVIESLQFDEGGLTPLTRVSYDYDALGRMLHTQVEDLASGEKQHTLVVYDDETLTRTLYEPNTGSQTTYSDVLGRIRKTVRQGNTNIVGQPAAPIHTSTEYDALGRVITSYDSESGFTDRYIYDAYQVQTFPDAIGSDPHCPVTALCEVIAGDGKSHDLYSYSDQYASSGIQLKASLMRRKGGSDTQFRDFGFQYEYDAWGRPIKETLPSNVALLRNYSDGMLSSVHVEQSSGSSQQIYALSDINEFGSFQTSELGNGVQVRQTLDSSGRLKRLTASVQPILSLNADVLFDEQYAMDSAANVLARSTTVFGVDQAANDSSIGEVARVTEQFIYDGLNRLGQHLKNTTFSSGERQDVSSVKDYAYDNFGNMLSGTYKHSYNYNEVQATLEQHCADNNFSFGTGPHTVRSTNDRVYCYDQFGRVNLTQSYTQAGEGEETQHAITQDYKRTITYNAFDKPLAIQMGSGDALQFEYGPDQMRQYSKSTVAGESEEVYYLLGGAYEFVKKANGDTVSRTYIDGIAVHEYDSSDRQTLNYFIKDYQGSTKLVLSENLETDFPNIYKAGFDYSPFGKQTGSELLGLPVQQHSERRGYTGHEHFQAFGIVHMNGRIYDPTLERFLSADPLVSQPLNSQRFNRYSYVMNNPMSFVDPSGYDDIGYLTVLIDLEGTLPDGRKVTGQVLIRGKLEAKVNSSVSRRNGTYVDTGYGYSPVESIDSINTTRNSTTGGSGGNGGRSSGGGNRGDRISLIVDTYIDSVCNGCGDGNNSGARPAPAIKKAPAKPKLISESTTNNSEVVVTVFAPSLPSHLKKAEGATREVADSLRNTRDNLMANVSNAQDISSAVATSPNTHVMSGSNVYAGSPAQKGGGWVPPSLPQGLVDAVAGFGDGVSTVLSFGMYSTADIRASLDIGSVNTDSWSYAGGKAAGYTWGAGIFVAGGLNGGANTVFWSGYNQGAMQAAARAGISLERTPIGASMNFINNKLGVRLPGVAWDGASAIFAANARGTASAVIRNASSGSTWSRIEQPILNARNVPIKYLQ